jgi:exosortase C (VPDSG-CTERM-specific)
MAIKESEDELLPQTGESGLPMTEASAPSAAPTSTRRSRVSGRLLAFLFFSAGLVISFGGSLVSLGIHAAGSPLHSHILLIPFVSAYLLYIRRTQLPNDYSPSPIWAMVGLLVGLAALFAAQATGIFSPPFTYNDHLALMTLSFISLLAAGGFVFLGQKWMLAATFPFTFLIFMVPMPDAIAEDLDTASKLATAEVASVFFNMGGTPVLRDSTVFQLPNITIQVAQECSGIRSSWVLVITSLLASNLFLKSPWRRAALVCFVVPLGIVRNGFRVWVIGMLCIHIGPQMIHSLVHRRGGPFFFVLSLIPLFFLLWWLRRGEAAAHDKAGQEI